MIADSDSDLTGLPCSAYRHEEDVAEDLFVELPVRTDPPRYLIELFHLDFRHLMVRKSVVNAQKVHDELSHGVVKAPETYLEVVVTEHVVRDLTLKHEF